jgi:hypothetical protein
VLWLKLQRNIRTHADVAARYGFEIVLKPISNQAHQERCKI